MNRIVSFCTAALAVIFAPAANANQNDQLYDLEIVELVEFSGGGAFVVAQERLNSRLLFNLQVVDLVEFGGGDSFADAQERLYASLLPSGFDETADASFPTLLAFDGERQFLKTSTRLRVWRPGVGYTLTVNPDGHVTQCELTEKFRRKYVNDKLCEVLSKHHHFEPARAVGTDQPVEAEYTSRLVYLDMREKLEK